MAGHKAAVRRKYWGLLKENRGAQLLEFAIAMPLLLVMLIGIVDFGQAYNLKQRLNNAAREGARFGASQSTLDLNCAGGTNPCSSTPTSVVAIKDVISNYLTAASVTQCTIGSATESQSGSTYTYTWIYTSTTSGCSNFSLVIDRGYTFSNGTSTVVASHVTLNYPCTWILSRVIGLLVRGSTLSLPNTISSDTIMQNLP